MTQQADIDLSIKCKVGITRGPVTMDAFTKFTASVRNHFEEYLKTNFGATIYDTDPSQEESEENSFSISISTVC